MCVVFVYIYISDSKMMWFKIQVSRCVLPSRQDRFLVVSGGATKYLAKMTVAKPFWYDRFMSHLLWHPVKPFGITDYVPFTMTAVKPFWYDRLMSLSLWQQLSHLVYLYTCLMYKPWLLQRVALAPCNQFLVDICLMYKPWPLQWLIGTLQSLCVDICLMYKPWLLHRMALAPCSHFLVDICLMWNPWLHRMALAPCNHFLVDICLMYNPWLHRVALALPCWHVPHKSWLQHRVALTVTSLFIYICLM